MPMFPHLSLTDFEIDPELARRLPRRLAYYHLAIPLADDEGTVTVAMAHPENRTVISVLQTVIGSTVSVVRSDPDQIRRALDSVWHDELTASGREMIYGGEGAFGAAEACLNEVAAALALSVNAAPLLSMSDLIAAAASSSPALVIVEIGDNPPPVDLIAKARAPLLLLRGAHWSPMRILQVVRGQAFDRAVLDFVMPLALTTGAQVNLLASASGTESTRRGPVNSNFAAMLSDGAGSLTDYGRILTSVRIEGRLRIHQQPLEAAIAAELNEQRYDLVALAAEAYGDFVRRVVESTVQPCHFLILKP